MAGRRGGVRTRPSVKLIPLAVRKMREIRTGSGVAAVIKNNPRTDVSIPAAAIKLMTPRRALTLRQEDVCGGEKGG